jgi:hypothetical protein
MSPHPPDSGQTPRPADEVEMLAAELLAQLEAGQTPNREALVRAHPHLGARLDRRLALVEMMYRVGLAPQSASSLLETTAPATDTPDVPAHQAVTVAAEAVPADAVTVASGQRSNPRDFEIISELGQGGMGVVYQARQLS